MAQKSKLLPSIFNRDFIRDPFSRFPALWQEFDLMQNENREEALNIFEENDHLVIEAALPGLNPDEIEINLSKGVLWIKGEKKEEEGDKNKKFYKRSVRSYSFSVALPEQVDEKQEPNASYDNGILRIVFPKAKQSETKRINIKGQRK
jgi:HSP20 family protein